tara:strand:- start:517 stop:1467 length:951 start_codon:yes stop_codon:yes gene_type:complete
MEGVLPKPDGWFEARMKGLGGSDIAAVLGLSKWSSPMDVWAAKRGLSEEIPETNAMRRGRLLESAIATWYQEETGYEVVDGEEMPIVGPKPFMLASPDRYVSAGKSRFGLEIKTARSVDGWGEDLGSGVPVYYATQAAWYMACTNIDRWDFAVLFLVNDEFRRYTLVRNKKTEKKLVNKCGDWWQKHVVGGEPPPIDGSPAADKFLQDKFGDPGQEYRTADPVEEELIFDLHDLQTEIKSMKEREALLKNQIKERIADNAGLNGVFGTVSWKMNKGRSSLDSKSLRKEHPEIAKQFTKTSEPSRIFRMNIQHKRGN